ncbi:hypothetical protein MF271_12270 [Deinococcus sp. KNUC1210]|uniref:hypothetical protein n=1 Tax=Deinococcus sp. KNUC1210 TaxID=2917691 RepID=UPI001EF110FE|nr:hypothetical protein [Deinococcus sp. KNUC1210]ULH14767.1 hypothetical protein MF271_12270 [Deinococcus sp. KNUC1210]
MKRVLLAAGLCMGLLGSCAYTGAGADWGSVQPTTYTLTLDNRACIIPAQLLIDGQNVGSTDAYQQRGFSVSPGTHTFQIPNDLNPQIYTATVTSNLTWHVRACL